MVAKYSYIEFHKNPPSEAELFHVDGNIDVTELRVAFRNCTNAPKKETYGRRVQCNLSVKKNQFICGEHTKYDCRIFKTVLHYFVENYEPANRP